MRKNFNARRSLRIASLAKRRSMTFQRREPARFAVFGYVDASINDIADGRSL
jgi:hypothetical protein